MEMKKRIHLELRNRTPSDVSGSPGGWAAAHRRAHGGALLGGGGGRLTWGGTDKVSRFKFKTTEASDVVLVVVVSADSGG